MRWPPTTGSSCTTSAATAAVRRTRRAAPRPSPTTSEAVLTATLAPGEQAVIAGHSMGGMTVMAAAAPAGGARARGGRPAMPARAVRGWWPPRPWCRSGGRVRTWLTRRILGSRAPLGPVTPSRAGSSSTGRWAPVRPRTWSTPVPAHVHACPRKVRHAWSEVLDLLDLDHGVRELTMPVEVVVGTADRLTPARARPLTGRRAAPLRGPDGASGARPPTPVEAPELVTGRYAPSPPPTYPPHAVSVPYTPRRAHEQGEPGRRVAVVRSRAGRGSCWPASRPRAG